MTTHTTSRSLSRRRALALGSASLSAALLAAGDQAAMAADTTPALERNRALVQRLFDDGVNGGDDHLVTTLYAPGPASEGAAAGEPAAVAGMPISLPDLHRAVPGVQATVDALVAEAALVAARVTWRAPHPPGGAHIVGETLHLFRIEGGQIVEQWAAGWEWLEARGVHTLCTPANPLLHP